jgi:hypothetical protein
MGDKAKPQGFATHRTVAPEGLSQRRATEDDDVEGHGFKHASDGISAKRITEPDGLSQRRATEDDDVEGHSFRLRSPSSKGE